jgi:HEAT repeat protein
MQTSKEKEIIESLSGDQIESMDLTAASEFCKLIETKDKAVLNDFAFRASNSNNENIAKAIVKYISSSDASVRNLAGEILISLGKTAIKPLIDFLPNRDRHDQKFAIDVLGLIGDIKAEEPILRVLQEQTDENVILACVEALGNIRSRQAVPYLVNLYGVNEVFIPTIIEALGKIASPEAIDLLMSAYSQQDNLIKFTILESLGNIGDEGSFYFIYSELPHLEGPLVWVAIQSIFKISQRLNIEIPFEEKFKSKLLETIYEADSEFRQSAIYLALNFDDKEILESLFTAIGENEELDEILKDKLFNNLGFSLEAFSRYIEKNPPNLFNVLSSFEALFEYPEFHPSNFLTPLELKNLENKLEDLLDSPYEEIRKSVMNLLFRIDTQEALLFIDKMMKDENIWNRLYLMDILENVELNETVLARLRKLKESEEEMIRERIDSLMATVKN